MFYPHGVVAPERREYRDLSQVDDLSLDACNDALDDLCASILSPPPGQFGSVRLWANASAYEPVQLAEKAIQGYVRTMLLGRYPGLIPVEEQITDAGRLDVGAVAVRTDVARRVGFGWRHHAADFSYVRAVLEELGRVGLEALKLPQTLYVHN